MISPTGGASAYNVIDQLSHPQQSEIPLAVPTDQNGAQSGGNAADKTDLSAQALALAKTIQQPGSPTEQQATHASGQGKTGGEQIVLPQPKHSINIHI